MERTYTFKTRASGKEIIVNCDLPESMNSGDSKYIKCDTEYFSFEVVGSFEIFEFFKIMDFLKDDCDYNKIYKISCKE